MVLGKSDLHMQKNETPLPLSIYEVTAKWIEDLSVRHKFETTRRKHRGDNSRIFFYLTPKEQETKAKIDKWDFIKPKSF